MFKSILHTLTSFVEMKKSSSTEMALQYREHRAENERERQGLHLVPCSRFSALYDLPITCAPEKSADQSNVSSVLSTVKADVFVQDALTPLTQLFCSCHTFGLVFALRKNILNHRPRVACITKEKKKKTCVRNLANAVSNS